MKHSANKQPPAMRTEPKDDYVVNTLRQIRAIEEEIHSDELSEEPAPGTKEPRRLRKTVYEFFFPEIACEDGLPLAAFVTHIIQRSYNQRRLKGPSAVIWDTSESFGERLDYCERHIRRLVDQAIAAGYLVRVKHPYAIRLRLGMKSLALAKVYEASDTAPNPIQYHRPLASLVGINAAVIYGFIRSRTRMSIDFAKKFKEPDLRGVSINTEAQKFFIWMKPNVFRAALCLLRKVGLIRYGPPPKGPGAKIRSYLACEDYFSLGMEDLVRVLAEALETKPQEMSDHRRKCPKLPPENRRKCPKDRRKCPGHITDNGRTTKLNPILETPNADAIVGSPPPSGPDGPSVEALSERDQSFDSVSEKTGGPNREFEMLVLQKLESMNQQINALTVQKPKGKTELKGLSRNRKTDAISQELEDLNQKIEKLVLRKLQAVNQKVETLVLQKITSMQDKIKMLSSRVDSLVL